MLVVTRSQERARESAVKEVKGRPMTLDWGAQEKVRSMVGEWVKETQTVIQKPNIEEVPVTENGVKATRVCEDSS